MIKRSIKDYSHKLSILMLTLWSLLAFSLSTYLPLSSLFIAGLIILYFAEPNFHKKFIAQFKNAYSYIFFLPFLLSIIGMIHTINTETGWHRVEVSLSLFIFPFLASDFKKNNIPSKWQLIFSSFTVGIIISFLMCIIRAIFRLPEESSISIFFYSQLSGWLIAPNYLSNFVIFSIIISTLELTFRKQTYLPIKSVALLITILLAEISFLVLLSSKASLLIFLITGSFFILYWGKHKILSWGVIAIIILFSISTALIVITQTNLHKRFSTLEKIFNPGHLDYTIAESTSLRYIAMQSSIDFIHEYWYIGVGTGDVRDELTKYYKNNQYIAAYKKGTNPHNQFLTSLMSFGIFGLISLILLYYALLRQAILHKNLLVWLWMFIMLILFLTDDLLTFQAGIIYFCIFSSLFTFALPNNTSNYDSFFTA
jgi:O-antigen ligase